MAFDDGVKIQAVNDLYAMFESLEIPGYYRKGEVNPLAGRVRVIPRDATLYAMIPERDREKLAMARNLLKGIRGAECLHEVICDKDEISYDQFARPGKVVVLYA